MDNDKQIELLKELIRGEKMAVDAYRHVIDMQKDKQVKAMLEKFADDHSKHVEMLSERVRELGGDPQVNTGISGFMANTGAIINSMLSPERLLRQVYNGEDKGIHTYEDRIDELDEESAQLVQNIMEEDHDHLQMFKQRMESEKRERD